MPKKTASTNIFIQPLMCMTDGVSTPFLLSTIIIMYLRGQQIAVFPRGTFLEVMDCHMVSFERKKKKKKNLKRFIMRPRCPGLTHLSFFFFPDQIELLEVDISRERKGCFLLQLECAISRKPGVSIALRPKGGKANKKRGAGGRVEDKELDGDGLLMDSTVPQCQFPFLIGGLFLKTNRGETDFFLYQILANSDTFILSRLF